ncbi:hypothetical protein RDV89_08020 [Nocardioides zeae]|uniref:PE domain-containing protein n=1 Tax=Nocardioides imazamoxiresistens TaxID=3231893 RepID=A0ABU3PW86_9ACTN|nr:hypothetical protein [Nocardioides zeae]MDT9593010.1 hypothetical protein [Nocardioides zeae]
MTLSVDPSQLQAAAAGMSELGSTVSGLLLGHDLSPLPGALPGSVSGPESTALGAAWDEENALLAAAVEGYVASMNDAATGFQVTDGAEAEAYGTPPPVDGPGPEAW